MPEMRGFPTSGYRGGASALGRSGFQGIGAAAARAALPSTALVIPRAAVSIAARVPYLGTAVVAGILAAELYKWWKQNQTGSESSLIFSNGKPDLSGWVPYDVCGADGSIWDTGTGGYCGNAFGVANGDVPLQSAPESSFVGANFIRSNDDGGTHWLGPPYRQVYQRNAYVKASSATRDFSPSRTGVFELPAVDTPEVYGPAIPWHLLPARSAVANPADSRGYDLPETFLIPYVPEWYRTNPGPTVIVNVKPWVAPTRTVVHNPAPALPKPPPPKTKEKKSKVYIKEGPGSLAGQAVRIFGLATEGIDMVECLFNAIPLKKRLKDKVTKFLPKNVRGNAQVTKNSSGGMFSKPSALKQAQYVAANLDDVDIAKAIVCMGKANASDSVIGKYSAKAAKVNRLLKGGGTLELGPAL